MVKLIVLDVDGVIVGHKHGVNFPYPNKKVFEALKKVRQTGIPVVLCSGKYFPAIEPIIHQAHLNNPHITDSGSLIIDPLENKTISSFYINKDLVSDILNTCAQNNIHAEVFSENGHYLQKNIPDEFVKRRTLIVQKDPILVDSLAEEAKKHQVIRLVALSFNENDREKIEASLKRYNKLLKLVWSMHPSTKPWEYYLITALNASKANALTKITQELDIPLNQALGVGDTLGDWEFMNLCGYVATMADASDQLKELVKSKKEGKHLIAPSVDEDGILKIFSYFLKN